jgi:hypothetical protein
VKHLIRLALHGGPVGRWPRQRILRPIWQIALLAPLAPIYYLAQLFVATVDKYL